MIPKTLYTQQPKGSSKAPRAPKQKKFSHKERCNPPSMLRFPPHPIDYIIFDLTIHLPIAICITNIFIINFFIPIHPASVNCFRKISL